MNTEDQYIDTHCHLDMSDYRTDLHEVISRAKSAGVSEIITIGIDLESSKKAIQLAVKHQGVYATVGIHPHDIKSANEDVYEEIEQLLKNHSTHVVGYGEIGLDYFRDYSPHALQREHFSRQLEIAKEHDLPVVIHDRDAHDDVLSILKHHGPFTAGGVMHCFSGNYHFAKRVLEENFYISIPGIVTFKNAKELQEVAQKVPLDRLLLETDGPFLAPTPYRGKRNEPAYVPLIAETIASLRGIPLAEIARRTTENARNLFQIESVEEIS